MHIFWLVLFLYSAGVPAVLGEQIEAPRYCKLPPEQGSCRAAFKKWFYNVTSRKCEPFYTCGEGNRNRFQNQAECNETCRNPDYGRCGIMKNYTGCKISKGRIIRGFWFNPNTLKCESHNHGDCRSNLNWYRTKEECYRKCGDFTSSPCVMPIDVATRTCTSNAKVVERYGYNAEKQTCEKFWHSECSGNNNNFTTPTECLRECNPHSRCLQAPTLSRNWGPLSKTVYYFDATKMECVQGQTLLWKDGYGPRNNKFRKQKECIEACLPEHKK